MKARIVSIMIMLATATVQAAVQEEGTIPFFQPGSDEYALQRPARPDAPFDRCGEKFALLGLESGSFEAWAYPLKLLRNFEFSFLLGTSTRPIAGRDIVRHISLTPAVVELTFAHQSFTVRAVYFTPPDEAGAFVLLAVDSDQPLTVVCGFLPVLQPMWPAGSGGQYAFWDESLHAYIISESARRFHGLVGSPAGRGISYTPAHMLSDAANEFKIEIPEPKTLKGKYIPIVLAGGQGKRDEVVALYRRLADDPLSYYQRTEAHFRDLRRESLRLRTPSRDINTAFAWGKIALDNLFVNNPDLGLGMIAGLGLSGSGGRPGFGWFFGGDACINSFALNAAGMKSRCRAALEFLRRFQRRDGKMAHEISQSAGLLDWFKDYGYGYIHADTTPFYLAAAWDYWCWSGDHEFIRRLFPSLSKAFRWCLGTDKNNDGLMDNRQAGLGALEYGALTEIESDVYLAAVWVRGALAMAELARGQGARRLERQAREAYARGLQAFRDRFWDESSGMYVYAFDAAGEQVREITPMNAPALWWEIGEAERSRRCLERMCAADLSCDWGVRMLSTGSRFYDPLGYNYGAAWPFSGGWVAAALFRHHLPQQGYRLLSANVSHTFDNQLGTVDELFSGSRNVWPQEGVSHQGFSTTGVLLPLVRGLFGLDADVPARTLFFSPHFPADWAEAAVESWPVAGGNLALTWRRQRDRLQLEIVSRDLAGYSLCFAPALGGGSRIRQALLDGRPLAFTSTRFPAVTIGQLKIPLREGGQTVEVDFDPVPEVLPMEAPSRTGDGDRGMKIVSVHADEAEMRVIVEGLPGREYRLLLANADLVFDVQGAELRGSGLTVRFPQESTDAFRRKDIVVRKK
jgi:hypothetical protein